MNSANCVETQAAAVANAAEMTASELETIYRRGAYFDTLAEKIGAIADCSRELSDDANALCGQLYGCTPESDLQRALDALSGALTAAAHCAKEAWAHSCRAALQAHEIVAGAFRGQPES